MRFIALGLMLVAAAFLAVGCLTPLTAEERAELLSARDKFEAAAETFESVTEDYSRAKAEVERIRAAYESGELSLSDYSRAKAEAELFVVAIETKWKSAKTDLESATSGFSAVQKKLEERSGSGVGAWLQVVLGGFGVEIPVGVFAAIKWWQEWRRKRQVGILSRAGARVDNPEDSANTFSAAIEKELENSGATKDSMKTVKIDAAAGII